MWYIRENTDIKYYLKYCILMLLIQRFYVSYVFRQLLIFAVTIEVTVTKYINFCNVIIDTVNEQINTIYKERGIPSCLKGTKYISCCSSV